MEDFIAKGCKVWSTKPSKFPKYYSKFNIDTFVKKTVKKLKLPDDVKVKRMVFLLALLNAEFSSF